MLTNKNCALKLFDEIILMIKNVYWFSCEVAYPLFLSDFNENIISQQILGQYSDVKLHENPSSRSQVVPCGQQDRHDEANGRFSQLCQRALKKPSNQLTIAYFITFSYKMIKIIFFIWRYSPHWARSSSFTRMLDHTQRRTTVSRNPLYEWLSRRKVHYLTTINNHNRQTSLPRGDSTPQFKQASGRRPTS